jgi:hypothetical protein
VEELGALVKALAQARAEFKPVIKNKTATIPMKSGGKYTYQYADIADLIEATAPALSKFGLIVQQRIEFMDGVGRVLATQVFHEGGGFLPASFHPLKAGGDVKDVGGELTYIRRYAYSAYLNIASDEDTDGASGDTGKPPASRPASKPAAVAPKPAAVNPAAQVSEFVKGLVADAIHEGLTKDQIVDICKANNLPAASGDFKTQAQADTLAQLLQDEIAKLPQVA